MKLEQPFGLLFLFIILPMSAKWLTPAYAGKTLIGGVERLEQEAHPRLCGESVDLADEVHGFAEDAHAVKLCAGEVDRRIAGILCPED